MSAAAKTADEWELEEIIEDLQARIPPVASQKLQDPECEQTHSPGNALLVALARGMIWNLRRLDLTHNLPPPVPPSWQAFLPALLRAGPVVVLCATAAWLAFVYARVKGVL